MYFLNGDRLYINPEKADISIDQQINNCFYQLTKINSGKEIFKLNFFVDIDSKSKYQNLKEKISAHIKNNFSEEILVNLIAQAPLTCKIIVEVFLFDPEVWNKKIYSVANGSSLLFYNQKAKILIGNVQANEKMDCRINAENAFAAIGILLKSVNFSVNSIVRQWNYIEDIIGFEGEKQKYQQFNDVRSSFYKNYFEQTGYPAATGIGTKLGGIIVEFVAIKSEMLKTIPIDNPDQIAAHHYSSEVLVGEACIVKTTPKFERARYLELFNRKLIFISGTASITGEKTIGVGNPEVQTEITIQNIKKLYSEKTLEKLSSQKLLPKYGHARVYLKSKKDFPVIKKTFKKHFGNLPVVYIIADICRPDLLVEIEGKVILE